jgi:hypothetical protein
MGDRQMCNMFVLVYKGPDEDVLPALKTQTKFSCMFAAYCLLWI